MAEHDVPCKHPIDGDTIVHQSEHDLKGGAELSTSILMALDSIPGYDFDNGETVMFDHIDLDALDELIQPVNGTHREVQVTFSVDQYKVCVTGAGEITIVEV